MHRYRISITKELVHLSKFVHTCTNGLNINTLLCNSIKMIASAKQISGICARSGLTILYEINETSSSECESINLPVIEKEWWGIDDLKIL